MADEEVVISETPEGTQAEAVPSDDDLSKAFDALNNKAPVEPEAPPPEPAAPAEPAPAEPEVTEAVPEAASEEPAVDKDAKPKADPDHPTNLGRKVKKLEDNVSELLKQNSELLSALKERLTPSPTQAQPQELEEPEVLTTSEDFERYLVKRDARAKEAQRNSELQYGTGYLKRLEGWLSESEGTGNAEVAEIHKLLTDEKSPFNVKRSANPETDFDINLAKAEAHFYKTRSATPGGKPNPLDKNVGVKPKSPLGVAGPAKSDTGSRVPDFKLSREALDLLRGTGITEEEAKKYLSAQGYVGGR
ncbi:MAG: hypothetical protein WC736_15415 [Gallionella sp.]|jgi:hypothetical protein